MGLYVDLRREKRTCDVCPSIELFSRLALDLLVSSRAFSFLSYSTILVLSHPELNGTALHRVFVSLPTLVYDRVNRVRGDVQTLPVC